LLWDETRREAVAAECRARGARGIARLLQKEKEKQMKLARRLCALSLLAACGLAGTSAMASSHSEAPFIKEMPKVDATDFYMFNSYEPGREGYVTIVANYYPLQDPYGGPNFFMLDPDAIYQIKVDNDGDAREDITLTFKFQNANQDFALDIGGVMVPVPLINIGPIGPGPGDTGFLNVRETFTCVAQFGDNPNAAQIPMFNADTGDRTFKKPVDYIGTKSIPNYEAYANGHVYNVKLPGSNMRGRLFVGQRKDSFVVNLGETFDLVNTNPLGPENGETDSLADKNVTSFILEVPKEYLLKKDSPDPVIGAWTTASLRRYRTLQDVPSFATPALEQGNMVQVSRLSMPLVNELVVGLRDKNKFNASDPKNDGQFLTYVTNPTLPKILNLLYGVVPPCLPRNDLVSVFLTGVEGLNKPLNGAPSEMLRLNTNTNPGQGGIAITPKGSQNRLGVIGGDLQGYPNGRRPGDDVVDISLRVVMGKLYPDAGQEGGCAPSGNLPLTDGAIVNDSFFGNSFPYLGTPIPGSPN
jgi:hypothetical protein